LLLQGSASIALALLAGCVPTKSPLPSAGAAPAPPIRLPFSANRPLPAVILQPSLPIPDVPLAVKIGQMLMLGFHGVAVDERSMIIQAIRQQQIGSVVFFQYNIRSPGQVRELTAALHDASSLPLIIAVDHEGGLVNRFRGDFGFTSNYSEQALGALNDLAVTRAQSENVAQQLASFGINLNLAPVVDLNLNPANPVIGAVQRSFSADPAVVVEQARAVIESHHKYNVLCTLKHFPGHGSSRQDSHQGFVDVSDTWPPSELTPYSDLLQLGLGDAVMTAHIFNAHLDQKLPATLSHAIVTGLLREKLGYPGVVISDDMQMRAISALYDYKTAIRLVIEAGVDIIAIANNLNYRDDAAERTVGIIHDLVTSGVLSTARIDQSYRRIMALKQRLLLAR
jgi:beta-N-acetylhexosaminidase